MADAERVQRRAAARFAAAVTAAEPVCGMVLGIVVFREKVPASSGMIALQIGGLATLVAGVVMVARAPALASIHAARHRERPADDESG